MTDPRDADATRLAAEALAAGDPTGWFERLYAEAAGGAAVVPWDRGTPSAMLVQWAGARPMHQGRAMVVGCGLGRDSEHIASLGYDTTAFDVSGTAVAGARTRHPASVVRYEVADLLRLPAAWSGAFDLVVESHTVQSLPVALHPAASAAVVALVAPGGTLLVLAAAGATGVEVAGPPWPLTRAEVEAFAVGDLQARSIEEVTEPASEVSRWRAEFVRPR